MPARKQIEEVYGLGEIIKQNRVKPKPPEDPWSRESSFVQSRQGIVLHSASLRSTAFIPAGPEADEFLRAVQTMTPEQRTKYINGRVAGAGRNESQVEDIVDQLIAEDDAQSSSA